MHGLLLNKIHGGHGSSSPDQDHSMDRRNVPLLTPSHSQSKSRPQQGQRVESSPTFPFRLRVAFQVQIHARRGWEGLSRIEHGLSASWAEHVYPHCKYLQRPSCPVAGAFSWKRRYPEGHPQEQWDQERRGEPAKARRI